MKTDKLFFASNYLLILLSVLPLLSSDKFGITDSLVVGGILIVCCFLEFRGMIPVFSATSGYIKYLLIGAIVLLMFSQQDKFLVLVWLTMLFLLSKVIVKKDLTDHLLVYMLTLVLLLFGAVVVVELYFSLIFIAYFFVITWCLLFYHLVSEKEEEKSLLETNERNRIHKESPKDETVAESFFWSVNGIIAFSLLFTLVVYFIFPRISSGFLKINVGETGLFTGFSDEVSLGEIGSINEDNGVAFRAEIFSGSRKTHLDVPRIYWWGKSLDHYENDRWSDSTKGRVPLKKEGYTMFRTSYDHEGRIYLGKMYVLPFQSNVLFFPYLPLGIRINEKSLNTPNGDGLNRERYDYKSIDYEITFSVNQRESFPYTLPRGYIKEAELWKKYLDLPEKNERLQQLALDVAGSTKGTLEKGRALESYFLGNFTYSLNSPDRHGIPPLDFFLFESKSGHCEYFSTAMALMMRSLGIPTRIVNGFAGGEWSEIGEYYIVRKKNAHSWVEVYHEGRWYPFDPTPKVMAGASGKGFAEAFTYYSDFAKMKWNQYFILYSWSDQVNMGLKLDSQGIMFRDFLNNILKGGFEKARNSLSGIGIEGERQGIVFALLIGGGAFLLVLGVRRFRYFTFSTDPGKQVSHVLIQRLRALGIEKKGEETFLECYQRNREVIDAQKGLREEIVRYYRLRFG